MNRHLLRDGALVGIIGGSVVAIWFLAIDLIAGHPLLTPTILGSTLLELMHRSAGSGGAFPILVYTIVHYAVWLIVGLIAIRAVWAAHDVPALVTAFKMFMVVLVIGISFLSLVLSQLPLFGAIAWYEMWVANMLAVAAMSWYIHARVPMPMTGMEGVVAR